MTILTSGSSYGLRTCMETSPGVLPGSPAFKTVRIEGGELDFQRDSFKAEELRTDREIQSMRLGMHKQTAKLETLLMLGNADDLIESALAGAWTAVTSGAISLQAVASTSKIVRTTGSFITDGFDKNDIVSLTGFSVGGNNQTGVRITAVSALELTLDATLTDDAAASGRTVALVGKKIKGSNLTMKTLAIEGVQPEIPDYELATHCAVNQMQITAKPSDGNVKAVFDLLGLTSTQTGTSAAASVVGPVNSEPIDTYTGGLIEGDTENGLVTSFEMTLANGRNPGSGVIGSAVSPGLVEGTRDISGSISAFFVNRDLADKFRGEISTSLDVVMRDVNGADFIRIYLPNVKLLGHKPSRSKDQEVIAQIDFQALYSPVAGTSIVIQRSNA